MTDQPVKDPRDGLTVFIEALQGADRVVVETKNALGVMEAHYIHAPEILAAWNTRAAPKVKPLEWVEQPSAIKGRPSDFRAEFYSFWWVVNESGSLTFSGDTSLRYKKFDTFDSAKAAAQEDFKRRILSALTPETET